VSSLPPPLIPSSLSLISNTAEFSTPNDYINYLSLSLALFGRRRRLSQSLGWRRGGRKGALTRTPPRMIRATRAWTTCRQRKNKTNITWWWAPTFFHRPQFFSVFLPHSPFLDIIYTGMEYIPCTYIFFFSPWLSTCLLLLHFPFPFLFFVWFTHNCIFRWNVRGEENKKKKKKEKRPSRRLMIEAREYKKKRRKL
jgi:hypothetical protein